MVKLLLILLALIAPIGPYAYAEENHQDKAGECRLKKTSDEQKLCYALIHKDGSGCESIKSFELRMHCMHEVAEFTRHDFNTYTPTKKAE